MRDLGPHASYKGFIEPQPGEAPHSLCSGAWKAWLAGWPLAAGTFGGMPQAICMYIYIYVCVSSKLTPQTNAA